MNNKDNERITYEEFMLMFRNAPRIAYTLYDKAEDEIDRLKNIINEYENKGYDIAQERADFLLEIQRLNNIINELEKWLNNQINDIKNNYSQYFNMNYVIDTYDDVLDKLKELKGDSNANITN